MTKNKIAIIILLILLFHMVNNYIIIVKQGLASLPVSVLESKGYAASLRLFYMLEDFFLKNTPLNLSFGGGLTSDPPIYFISTAPFYFLFGNSKGVAIMSNSLYLSILLFSIYGIGKRLSNKEVGLFAAFIVSVMPAVFGYSRVYHIPFSLIALTTLTIYFLLETGYFSNIKYSALFGISMGILGLTRYTGAVYIIGPFLFVFFDTFVMHLIKRKPISELRNKMINFLLSLIICAITLSFWYIYKMRPTLMHYVNSHNMDSLVNNWKMNANLEYLFLLINSQLLPVLSILFFVSLIFFIFSRARYKFIISSWILVPYLFFTFFWHGRESYQTIPCLPAIALIISFSILKFVPKQKIRLVAIAVFIYFAIFQFFSLSYKGENIFLKDYHLQRLAAGKKLKHGYQEALRQIMAVITTKEKNTKILFLSITSTGLALESLLHEEYIKNRMEVLIDNPLGWISSGSKRLDDLGIDKDYFLNHEFLVYTSNNREVYDNFYLRHSLANINNDLVRLMDLYDVYKKEFALIKVVLSEDCNFLIYKKIRHGQGMKQL